jgi:hypothetical protein
MLSFAGHSVSLPARGFLRVLSENHDVQGWENVATTWLWTCVGIGIAMMLVTILIKGVLKWRAGNVPVLRNWRPAKTIILWACGLSLVLCLLPIWAFSRDIFNVIHMAFWVGFLLCWAVYSVLFRLVNLLHPGWRREIW